jgi:hypothetical protein
MPNIVLEAHSGWRYIVIIAALILFARLLWNLFSGARWGRLDQQLSLAFLITMDIQLLLGLVLWIMEQRWSGGDPLRSWEHPITMILAVAATHITWSRLKTTNEESKVRVALFGFAVAAVLLTIGILRITGQMG